MGFGKVKCLFNQTEMNATIVSETMIKCDSPRLNDDQAVLEAEYLKSFVQITLNGVELTEEKVAFAYYPEVKLLSILNNKGPLSGGTSSLLSIEGIRHPNVCNTAVKYGPIEVEKPLLVSYKGTAWWKVYSP